MTIKNLSLHRIFVLANVLEIVVIIAILMFPTYVNIDFAHTLFSPTRCTRIMCSSTLDTTTITFTLINITLFADSSVQYNAVNNLCHLHANHNLPVVKKLRVNPCLWAADVCCLFSVYVNDANIKSLLNIQILSHSTPIYDSNVTYVIFL